MAEHTSVEVAEVPATCTSAGKTAGTKCSVCGTILSGCEVIPVVDHTVETVAEVPATCTSAGRTAGTKCSVCGEILSGCDTIGALGHDFENAVDSGEDEGGTYVIFACTRCSETYKDYGYGE